MKKVTNKLGILLTIIATCAFMTACGGEEPAGGGAWTPRLSAVFIAANPANVLGYGKGRSV